MTEQGSAHIRGSAVQLTNGVHFRCSVSSAVAATEGSALMLIKTGPIQTCIGFDCVVQESESERDGVRVRLFARG